MALNHTFWSSTSRHEFSTQLAAIVDALETRILPAFDGVDKEGEAVAKDAWERFMSAPGTGDEEPGDFVEAAEQAGVSHYVLLHGIRQGMLNLFAAALYHAFEQQVMLLFRREILDPQEENDSRLFQMMEFQKRLKGLGIDITEFSSWSKIDELRLVANTVKHAEGDSAQKLHGQRPDLFEHPDLRKQGLSFGTSNPHVFLPLPGEDLYVSLEDIRQYRDALLEFWKELGDAMGRA